MTDSADVVVIDDPAAALAIIRQQAKTSKKAPSRSYLIAAEQALMLRILNPSVSDKDLAGLTRSLCGVRDQLRIIAGTPLPGSRRPSEVNDNRSRRLSDKLKLSDSDPSA